MMIRWAPRDTHLPGNDKKRIVFEWFDTAGDLKMIMLPCPFTLDTSLVRRRLMHISVYCGLELFESTEDEQRMSVYPASQECGETGSV